MSDIKYSGEVLNAGMVIIPTELLTDNGKKLKAILTGSGGIQ